MNTKSSPPNKVGLIECNQAIHEKDLGFEKSSDKHTSLQVEYHRICAKYKKVENAFKKLLHDIRSPIASCKMVISSLESNKHDQTVSKNKERPIKRQTNASVDIRALLEHLIDRMNEMVSIQFDWIKKESSSSYLNKIENVDAPTNQKATIDIVRELHMMVRAKNCEYEHSNIEIVLQVQFDHSLFLEVKNLSEFRSMLSNLINNAVEATLIKDPKPIGIVKVLVKCNGDLQSGLQDNDYKECLTILIEDEGVGMSKDVIDKILGEKPVTHGKPSGNGIGFSQIISTIKANRGKLYIASTVGDGSLIMLQFLV